MTAPLKLLVLGCSALSTGELTIVLDWARRCRRPIDLQLLVPSPLAPHLAWAGRVVPYPPGAGDRSIEAIAGAVESLRPDLFVIADLLLWHAAPHELGASLAPVLGRALTACGRVAALDLYDWDARSAVLECYGRARFATAPAMPPAVSRLMPSPYLAPARSGAGRGRFAMMGDGAPLSNEERAAVRRELGADGRPLVLTLTSPWQHVAQSLPDASGVTRRFPALMLRLLDEAASRAGDATLIHVGPAAITVPGDVAHLRYQHVAQMPPDRFRRVLGAADLVLTSNCIASSVVRGASMRVPVATLRLEAPSLDERERTGEVLRPRTEPGTRAGQALATFLREATPVYGFLVWPLGLRRAMRSILEHNPFEAIQAHFDAMAPDAAVDGLARLLTDPARRDDLRQAQDRYFAILARETDDADTALEAVL